MKKFLLILLSAMMLLVAGCGNTTQGTTQEFSVETATFEELVEHSKGTTVSFYGWGGDEDLNKWLDEYYAPLMKEKYDITIKRVAMGIEDILPILVSDKEAGNKVGIIDMIWINGENFRTAKENDLLYGPFLSKVENYEKYVDTNADDIIYDFGYKVDGFEAPYGKAQVVYYKDADKMPETPRNAAELLELAKKYPGKITYPALPDFTGSVFVRGIIYDLVGYEQFLTMENASKEEVKQAIQPALDYLKELNPYLWNEGKTFPNSSTTMHNMFADGELYMGLTYGAYSPIVDRENGKNPPGTVTFQFDKGTIGNTNFLAIAKNAPNPAGAIVAINEMMSPEVQGNRFSVLKTLTVVDYNKLNDEQKQIFDAVELGDGAVPQDELLSKRLPEMPSSLVPIIEEIWLEEVVGK